MKNAIVTLFAAALISGCATAPVEVSDSQLNWLNITYKPAEQGAKPSRINLIGVGSIEFMEGRSPRVANDFAQDTEHEHWQDFYQEKLGVPPDVIRGWLQIFVDAGMLEKSKNKIRKVKDGTPRDIAVFHANIDMDKYVCITDDDELLAQVRRLVAIVKTGKTPEKENGETSGNGEGAK